MEKTAVVISRKWNNPKITVMVTSKEISMEVSIDQYLESLLAEMGNPTLLVTKEQLKNKLFTASAAVIQEFKGSTRFVV